MEANLLIAAVSGLLGAAIMTILMYLLKGAGFKLDIPYLLGTAFFDPGRRTGIYISGIVLHLLIGAGWGLFYVFTLTAMVLTPNWPAGILYGFAHGIFIGTIMGNLGAIHPRIGEDKPISDPGILGRRWGASTPYQVLGLHVIYGVCTLGIYYRWMFGG